jgi:predicted small secreted protein
MLILRNTLIIAVLASFGLTMAGCANTMRGAGKDIENTGEAVKDAAS